MSFSYQYARPALSVDCVVFGLDDDNKVSVLLIQRAHSPYQGEWALPGGFVEIDETLEQAVQRELQEETGLIGLNLEQLFAFSEINRDPRDRVISVAYYGLVTQKEHSPQAASDARSVAWHPITDLPPLAFDHRQILDMAYQRGIERGLPFDVRK